MLVLSREVGEKILIGPDIEVVVLSIDRGHVRLGIACPKEVRVDRQEVRERQQRDERLKREQEQRIARPMTES